MMIKLFYALLVHCVFWSAIESSCPGPGDESVPWWILYQQKQKPFMHFYIDSNDINQITPHFPENENSVLSKAITSLIDNKDTEYMVYTSDLINAAKISKISSIPMNAKLMHGIMVSETSWTSGYWILHNNLYFPPLKDGSLDRPGGDQWQLSTVGDTSADIFYICLSADSREEVKIMIWKMLAGNPMIYLKHVQSSFLDINLQAVTSLNTSFWLHWSASFFMNCMYAANTDEIAKKCLYNYSISIGSNVRIYTRPRGMIRHSKAFCYNSKSNSLYEFVELRETSSNNPDWSKSMFALTDQQDSSLSDVTCFGQDIAANTETVAIMVCFQLPRLYKALLRYSKISHWSCPNRSPASSKTRRSKNSPTMSTVKDDAEDKQVEKYCDIVDCSGQVGDTKQLQKSADVKTLEYRDSKFVNRFHDVVSDISLKTKLIEPSKFNKEKPVKKFVRHIRRAKEVNKYLIKNTNAVLALFCTSGCGFCQKAKNEFSRFNGLYLDDFDFLIVDVAVSGLPPHLQAPWTPFLRFKASGVQSNWIDYTGAFTYFSMLNFLHSNKSFSVKNTEDKIKLNSLENQGHEQNNSRENENKTIPIREKREVSDNFVWRHLWPVSWENFMALANLDSGDNQRKTRYICTRLARLAKWRYTLVDRDLNTFVVFNGNLIDLKTMLGKKIKSKKDGLKIVDLDTSNDNVLLVHVGMYFARGNLKIKSIKLATRATLSVIVSGEKINHLGNVRLSGRIDDVFPVAPPSRTCSSPKKKVLSVDIKDVNKVLECDLNKNTEIEKQCMNV